MILEKPQSFSLGLTITALVCWAVMFLAGTDVWHDLGRPDLSVAKTDLRAFQAAYYLLFAVLAGQLVLAVRARRAQSGTRA
jgi:hypothetical protein